jgi:hypothetical protein
VKGTVGSSCRLSGATCMTGMTVKIDSSRSPLLVISSTVRHSKLFSSTKTRRTRTESKHGGFPKCISTAEMATPPALVLYLPNFLTMKVPASLAALILLSLANISPAVVLDVNNPCESSLPDYLLPSLLTCLALESIYDASAIVANEVQLSAVATRQTVSSGNSHFLTTTGGSLVVHEVA